MSYLRTLLNPPATNGQIHDYYNFFNGVDSGLKGLTSVENASVLVNANFATLGPGGLTPTTQADGDGAEFMDEWLVYGAANANYVLTPTAHASNSIIQSASDYYVHVAVSTFNGGAFYFSQKQLNTVRKYQQDYLTYSIIVKNNQSQAIKLRMDIFSFYDPSSTLTQGSTFFLQPGIQTLSCKIPVTESLQGKSVGGGNYTEFRFNFLELVNGTANIDLYQIKCEFGRISTPLKQ